MRWVSDRVVSAWQDRLTDLVVIAVMFSLVGLGFLFWLGVGGLLRGWSLAPLAIANGVIFTGLAAYYWLVLARARPRGRALR